MHLSTGTYVKIKDSNDRYEPALVIINETSPRYKGMCFIIALSAMWKYVEPFHKRTAPRLIERDRKEFQEMKDEVMIERADLDTGAIPIRVLTPEGLQNAYYESNKKIACIMFAEALARSNGILLKTGYNLAMCMQMFDIPARPEAAAQLLMFIEDGLEDLKNAPPPPEEQELTAGGMEITMGGEKVYSGDWKVKESDVIAEKMDFGEGEK
jgi:hypothetical protein